MRKRQIKRVEATMSAISRPQAPTLTQKHLQLWNRKTLPWRIQKVSSWNWLPIEVYKQSYFHQLDWKVFHKSVLKWITKQNCCRKLQPRSKSEQKEPFINLQKLTKECHVGFSQLLSVFNSKSLNGTQQSVQIGSQATCSREIETSKQFTISIPSSTPVHVCTVHCVSNHELFPKVFRMIFLSPHKTLRRRHHHTF